jgi:lysophospholipase L1-like esterase
MAPPLETPRGPFTSLVVLGESTVVGGGWLAATGERWADILAGLIESAQERPLKYHNAGVGASVIAPSSPGYQASTKPSAAERLDDAVIAHRPDLVVIAYGLNDMRAGMPLDVFCVELENLVARLQKTPAPPLIVLANVYYMTTYQFYPPFDRGSFDACASYNTAIATLAATKGCVLADVHSSEAGADHVVHQDTVHANKLGNLLIAHAVFRAIALAAPGIADAVRHRDQETSWTRQVMRIMKAQIEPSHGSQAGR